MSAEQGDRLGAEHVGEVFDIGRATGWIEAVRWLDGFTADLAEDRYAAAMVDVAEAAESSAGRTVCRPVRARRRSR